MVFDMGIKKKPYFQLECCISLQIRVYFKNRSRRVGGISSSNILLNIALTIQISDKNSY